MRPSSTSNLLRTKSAASFPCFQAYFSTVAFSAYIAHAGEETAPKRWVVNGHAILHGFCGRVVVFPPQESEQVSVFLTHDHLISLKIELLNWDILVLRVASCSPVWKFV